MSLFGWELENARGEAMKGSKRYFLNPSRSDSINVLTVSAMKFFSSNVILTASRTTAVLKTNAPPLK